MVMFTCILWENLVLLRYIDIVKKGSEIFTYFHSTEYIFLTKQCLYYVAISKVIIKVNKTNPQKYSKETTKGYK